VLGVGVWFGFGAIVMGIVFGATVGVGVAVAAGVAVAGAAPAV
jgi:hypothetical protein